MKEEPRVPSAYRLVTLGRRDDVVETARSLARGGAEDGTLVWSQPAATGPSSDDFVCAVVLTPKLALRDAAQLSYVGGLGLSEALGPLLPPAPLLFEWPGTLLLNGCRLGDVRLETAPGTEGQKGNVDWVLLRAQVNVGRRRPDELARITSLYDEGCGDATSEDLLERFARHFLSWVNRWLDDGFGPVRSSWLRRIENMGASVTVRVRGAEVTGTFVGVDEHGRLELDTDGGRRTIEVYQAAAEPPQTET